MVLDSENNFAGVLVEGFNGFPNGTPFIGDVYKANEEIIANWLITALNYLKGRPTMDDGNKTFSGLLEEEN